MQKIRNIDYLVIGLMLSALTFNLFLSPYNIAAGGISGISLFFNKFFALNESIFIFICNICLLLISFIFLGKEKTYKSVLGSILYPIFISLTSFVPKYIDFSNLDMLVIAVLAGIIGGIGSGLTFKGGYTSGGTDILNQLMEKYMHIPIGSSIIIIDGTITILGGIIFGLNKMIYATITLLIIGIFNNKMLLGINSHKSLYIYSKEYEKIKQYLQSEFKYDSTNFEIQGGFTNQKGKLILTVINTRDYYKIKLALKLIDPNAFIVVTKSYQQVNANVTIRN